MELHSAQLLQYSKSGWKSSSRNKTYNNAGTAPRCAWPFHIYHWARSNMIDVGHLTNLMESRGIARKSDLVGVSEAQILNLEKYFTLSFPRTYREFLRNFGRSAGLLSPWMAIYFDDLKEIRDQFDCLIAADGHSFTLPEKALLIGNWESVFDYLVCDGRDDPEVYRVDLYQAEVPHARLYAKSYSAYLENMIKTADISALPADLLEDEALSLIDDSIRY